jgi:hypothetical protein
MKLLILSIFLFSIAHSQKSGSIFNTLSEPEIVNEDPSDPSTSSSSESGAPLTSTSTSKTTGSDEVTSTPSEDPQGEDDQVPTGDGSLSSEPSSSKEDSSSSYNEEAEKEELSAENEELESNINSLETDIAATLQEIEHYRYLEAEILKNYAEIMENLTRQIEELEESTSVSTSTSTSTSTSEKNTEGSTSAKQSSSQASVVGIYTDSDDDEIHYNSQEVSLIIISVIGLGFLFLLLHNIRKFWLLFPTVEMHHGVYTLLVDATILVFIWCITAILEYLDLFDIDVYTILVGLVIFTFFWLVFGLWVLFVINLQSQKWRNIERKLAAGQEKDVDLEYATLRQLFITPVYTPPATECELSPSFDFAVYLSKGLGQVVQNSLRITWIGYFFIIFCIIFWRTLAENSQNLEIFSLWILPGVLFVVILILLFKMNRIFRSLVPECDDFEISLSKNPSEKEVRSRIPKPGYLQKRIPEDVTCRFLCIRFNPFKLTCAWLFLSRFPNRHELQFWFDSYGPTFLSIMIQVISVLHTLWMTAIVLFYFPVFIDEAESYGIYLVLLGVSVWLINGFYFFPKLLVNLCLVSKVELMKDRVLIDETVDFIKKQMIDKTVKIYRQLKMIYREVKGMEEGEERTEILDYMKKIAEEVFLLYADNERLIHATQIDDVLGLIGIRLSEDELRLFAKECSPDKDNFVDLRGFLIAIERVLYGFDLNPADVVRYVLVNYFKKARKMTIADLTDFFDEWSWHFNEDILKDFLLESETLADEAGQFRIHDVGNMVKVHVEACPK